MSEETLEKGWRVNQLKAMRQMVTENAEEVRQKASFLWLYGVIVVAAGVMVAFFGVSGGSFVGSVLGRSAKSKRR